MGHTPWMDWLIAKIGWTEFDHDHELSKYWAYTTYKAHTVIGAAFAWCAMAMNAALFETGYMGTGKASAYSFFHFGTPVAKPVFGCGLLIRHTSGKYHVTFFHHWIDEAKQIAGLLGGNQDNAIKIKTHYLQGNAAGQDEIITCFWPQPLAQGPVIKV